MEKERSETCKYLNESTIIQDTTEHDAGHPTFYKRNSSLVFNSVQSHGSLSQTPKPIGS